MNSLGIYNMKQNLLVLIVGLLLCSISYASISPRLFIPLNKEWGYKSITSATKKAPLTPVTIPHTWNAEYLPNQISYNREMMIYKRTLTISPDMKGKRLFLFFEGVNSVADVFVNYQTVAHHLGGYTAFCTEITDQVEDGENDLEVWVSNAYRTDVLPISGDFNVYGGIHRPCHLIITENNCISPLFFASSGVFVHQKNISEKKAEFEIESRLSLKGMKSNLKIRTTILDEAGKIVTSQEKKVINERVVQAMAIQNPVLWDAKHNPYLYTVNVELYEDNRLVDKVIEQTGFRYFSVDPDNGFFLNGKPYDIHGFCRHEDVKGKGSALLPDDYAKDMELIKEVGATGMRLTHYPHAKKMHDLCDRNGIILWAEIPLVGPGGYAYTGYVSNQGLHDNARQTLKELVFQNYNHPSICFWGIFNELLITDGKTFQAYDNPVSFVKELDSLFKRLDPSRLTTFATCVDQTNYLGCADLMAWNKYFNWNDGKQIGSFMDKVKANSQNYPVGVSEYGFGGSIYQHRCPVNESEILLGRLHPEEFQTISHEKNWEALAGRSYLWAKFIWVFADFQSVIRKEGDRDGINDKGLVTYDRQIKKDAFYFYKANWNTEPMLHLCDSRFTERFYSITSIKAYTNLEAAILYVNGKKIGKMKRDKYNRVIWNNILLQPGENIIRIDAKNGKKIISESCVWTLKL